MKYETPRINRIVRIVPKESILAGSVADEKSSIESTGHEVADYDFAAEGFEYNWQ